MTANDDSNATSDSKRQMLRHTVATLAYRGAKAIDGAPSSFASFRASGTTRTPVEILSHIGDLLNWAHTIARGAQAWPRTELESWDAETSRFFSLLGELDGFLASDAPMEVQAERLFQAPIADALTHVGQLTMLRRIAGSPIRGENYFQADIRAGQVGPEQSTERVEFE